MRISKHEIYITELPDHLINFMGHKWAAYMPKHPGLLSLGETENVALMTMFYRIRAHQFPNNENEKINEDNLINALHEGIESVQYDETIESYILDKMEEYERA